MHMASLLPMIRAHCCSVSFPRLMSAMPRSIAPAISRSKMVSGSVSREKNSTFLLLLHCHRHCRAKAVLPELG